MLRIILEIGTKNNDKLNPIEGVYVFDNAYYHVNQFPIWKQVVHQSGIVYCIYYWNSTWIIGTVVNMQREEPGVASLTRQSKLFTESFTLIPDTKWVNTFEEPINLQISNATNDEYKKAMQKPTIIPRIDDQDQGDDAVDKGDEVDSTNVN